MPDLSKGEAFQTPLKQRLRKVFQTSRMLGGQRVPTQFERKAAIRNITQGSPRSLKKTTRKKKKYGLS